MRITNLKAFLFLNIITLATIIMVLVHKFPGTSSHDQSIAVSRKSRNNGRYMDEIAAFVERSKQATFYQSRPTRSEKKAPSYDNAGLAKSSSLEISSDPEISFRERFQLWDRSNLSLTSKIGGPGRLKKPEKYLIYRCGRDQDNYCGGWADRVKGIILTYVIANLTGRVFKVDIVSPPCNLKWSLAPNAVNWSLPTSYHYKLDENVTDAISINKINCFNFKDRIKHMNFTKELLMKDTKKYVYFKTNLDCSTGLRDSTIYHRKLSWMTGLRPDQIISTLYKRVFKLSPRLEIRMRGFMERALPTKDHRLICAHVRMGANPNLRDTVVRQEESDLAAVWKFLSNHSRSDKDRIFLMSDSENVTSSGKLQPFGHRMVGTEGPVNHIDFDRQLKLEDRCRGVEKVIFDQHVLMQCDVLLISKSGLSRLAAFVRASDRGLFCLFKGGRIEPCKMDHIKKLYDIKG